MTTRGIWFTFTITALVVAIQAEISNKRIPSGFQGMRGKKSVDLSNMEEAYYQQNDADRIPYFNSRFSDSPYLDPLQADLLYGYPNNLNLLKRAPMGFQGMRGKKNYLMDTEPLYHETSLTDNLFGVDTFEKRGPMGFQGMRGKREFEYPVLAYPNKRTPMGFQGMRGKKSEPDFSMEYLHTFDDENDKLYQDSFKNDKLFDDGNKNGDSHTNDKSLESVSLEQSNNGLETGVDGMISMKQRRAQNLGFFGVRGKKMPSSASFFGMRGKKGPYDYPFRGKFVGVRGKKLSAGRPSELQMLSDRLSWNDDSFEKRKGPSGFVGMRGKKWIAPEADLSQAESTSNGNGEE